MKKISEEHLWKSAIRVRLSGSNTNVAQASVKPLENSEQLIFFPVLKETIWVDEDARTDYASSQNIATLAKELKEKGPFIPSTLSKEGDKKI